MRGRLAAGALTALLALGGAAAALGGCGDDAEPPPSDCFRDTAIRAALAQQGDERRLADGAPLSRCVALSTSDEFLQDLGLVLTGVAHDLAEAAEQGDTAAAERLGYLVGAATRGAQRGQGIQLELVRRLESDARRVTAESSRRSLVAGLRAGERSG